jgi:hypothetical protein
VTASTGNHALAVAWAARRLAHRATVVVPASTSPVKLAALRQFPAIVIVHGHSYEHAEQHAGSLAEDGPRYLSASCDPDLIALPGRITLACGVGGGGLAFGLGLAATRSGRMTIIEVEAAASPAMSTALRTGQVTTVDVGNTLADGLAGNLEPGSTTVDLIRQHVHSLVSVTEDQIAAGIRLPRARARPDRPGRRRGPRRHHPGRQDTNLRQDRRDHQRTEHRRTDARRGSAQQLATAIRPWQSTSTTPPAALPRWRANREMPNSRPTAVDPSRRAHHAGGPPPAPALLTTHAQIRQICASRSASSSIIQAARNRQGGLIGYR